MTRRWVQRSANVGLSVLAAVGTIFLVVILAGLLFDVKALVFKSGSMGPSIGTGALAFARPVAAADLAVGDVVSVPVGETRVTHRIAEVTYDDDRAVLTLKGDANSVPDTATYTVDSADRVLFHVPKLGYVVEALAGPIGIFLGGMLAVVLLYLIFRPRRTGSEPSRGRHTAQFLVLVSVLGLGSAGITTRGAIDTFAYFTDSASGATGQFKTLATIPPPSRVTCVPSPGLIANWAEAQWPNTDPRVDYVAELWYAPNIGAHSLIREIKVTNAVAGDGVPTQNPIILRFSPSDLPTKSRYYNIVVYSQIKNAPAWVSDPVAMNKRFFYWDWTLLSPPNVTC